MLLLQLDDNDRKPKYQQIIDQIRQKIQSKVLRPGEPLPSTRRLAEKLEVHRSTVSTAYQELWALGFIDLRVGSRPRVRQRTQVAAPADGIEKGIIDWNDAASNAANSILQTYSAFYEKTGEPDGASAIDFSSLDMDGRLFPLENFRSCLGRALKEHGMSLLGYGEHAGYSPLRKYIARHLQSHGISVSAGEIMITNGSQHGIDLVFRMIAAPGKTVAIESPSYNYMLPMLRFTGLTPLEVPLRGDGMDLDALAEMIKKDRPALVYTMPNFHNPTGISTDQAHRERLLRMCETRRIPILEDGFEEEMKYFGKEILPIKSMDRRRVVIYSGTFSKVLFPGVRIGWLAAARDCIDRLIAIRRFSELAPSMILQAGMYEFCRSGCYDRHISKMHRVFRKRMQTALSALRQHISPEWAQWREPNGGYLIWLKLKPFPNSSPDLQQVLTAHGIKASPGRHYFFSQTADHYLRLSISTLSEQEITEGVKRLSKALASIYTKVLGGPGTLFQKGSWPPEA